jgi:hypothetical protein
VIAVLANLHLAFWTRSHPRAPSRILMRAGLL